MGIHNVGFFPKNPSMRSTQGQLRLSPTHDGATVPENDCRDRAANFGWVYTTQGRRKKMRKKFLGNWRHYLSKIPFRERIHLFYIKKRSLEEIKWASFQTITIKPQVSGTSVSKKKDSVTDLSIWGLLSEKHMAPSNELFWVYEIGPNKNMVEVICSFTNSWSAELLLRKSLVQVLMRFPGR